MTAPTPAPFDKAHIGHRFAPFDVEVEKGAIRAFARAIGETDPVHFDEAAARAAGYPSLLAPPTFLSSLQAQSPVYFPVAALIGFDESAALHASQAFDYLKPICAGDILTLRDRVADIYDKKNGALNFVVTDTEVQNAAGELVARSRETLVIRTA